MIYSCRVVAVNSDDLEEGGIVEIRIRYVQLEYGARLAGAHHAGEEAGGPLVLQRLLQHLVDGQLASALQHRLGKIQRHREAGRCRACTR